MSTRRISVFIDDGKRGAAHSFSHFFYSAECPDKTCFTRTHITLKSIYFFIREGFPENTGHVIDIRQGITSIPFNKDSPLLFYI